MRAERVSQPQCRVGPVVVVVVVCQNEAAKILRIDNCSLSRITGSELLIDVPSVEIVARANCCGETWGNIVGRRDGTDESVARILKRIAVLEPVRIVVVAVIPVIFTIRRAVV